MLFQTDNPKDFIQHARDHADHYGKHGFLAFMAAHNDNCVVEDEGNPDHGRGTCLATWSEYNALLDEYNAAHAESES